MFYGSLKIIKYLYENNVKLDRSLWLYAIHSRNFEIIQFLEEKSVEKEDKTYKECIIESIKCHHNDMIRFIQNKYLKSGSGHLDNKIFIQSLEFYNFDFLPFDYIDQSTF